MAADMTEFFLERLAHDAVSSHSQFMAADGVTVLCQSVERSKGGQDHPRIPPGRFRLIRRQMGPAFTRFDRPPKNFPATFAPWYKGIIEVFGVPGRGSILIHPANNAVRIVAGVMEPELLGCIAPAMAISHDITLGWTGSSSRDAWSALYQHHLYPALDAGDTFLVVRDLD